VWWVSTFPWNTISVLLIALIISLVVSVLNKRFVDTEKVVAWTEEIKKWQEEYRKATERGDKKALAKLKRKEKWIKEISSSIFYQQIKMLLISFAVVVAPLFLLRGFYGRTPMVTLPMPFPALDRHWRLIFIRKLDFYGWWFLCSLAFGVITTRVFRRR